MEGSPLVPGVADGLAWFIEFEKLIYKLDAIEILKGLRAGMRLYTKQEPAAFYILILNSEKSSTSIKGFPSEQSAAEAYSQIERETFEDLNINVVMVSVDSIQRLQEAFPNYYMDTSLFVSLLEGFLTARIEQRKEMFSKMSKGEKLALKNLLRLTDTR